MNITQMLVPDAYVFTNSNGYQRKWLVLHKTGGGSTAQATAQYFQNGAPQANGTFAYTSVHYVVGLDGAIVQCVREQDGAGGNCCLEGGHDAFWPTTINLNWVTFSIESVDSALDNSTPMPTAQKQSLFWLVKDLCTRQNIPMRPADSNGGITGHSSIAPQSRAHCPGNFPWSDLWTYLKGGGSVTGVPQGWQDDGTTLTANGHKVVKGFRDWILTHDWDPNDVPCEDEHAASPVEISNSSLGNGTIQSFNYSRLTWTPNRGVFRTYIGREAMVLRQKLGV